MVDAVGGVAKIVGVALKIKEAANTVHQNKKDCHHIKSRVDILNRTLSYHEHNTELVEDSAVMAALEALDGILAEALEVITKCQKPRTIICVYYTAGNLSRQLSKVEQRISYLSSDVMLTIMSYQLLKKSQEGAPHPPLQMSKQNQDEANKKDPTRTSQMSKQNQDEANKKDHGRRSQVPKFGEWDEKERTGSTVQFDRVKRHRGPRKSMKKYQDEANKKNPTGTSQVITKFGDWDVADHTKHAEGNPGICMNFGRPRGERRTAIPKFGDWDAADDTDHADGNVIFMNFDRLLGERRTGEMTGEPRTSLVHRIAEVTRNIKEAVGTVLQNKADCVEIGKCANKVSSLLPQLEDTKMADEPAMRGALEKLLLTFRRAHTLVIACQRRGLVIAWLSTPAGRLSIQLHEVLDQIASNIADMTAIVLP